MASLGRDDPLAAPTAFPVHASRPAVNFGAEQGAWYGAGMAEPTGIVGSVDRDGFLRFRHITVDHDELMSESLEEDGVLYECPLCVGETVRVTGAGPFELPDGAALRSSTGDREN